MNGCEVIFTDYDNSLRYAGEQYWFDFWNARVVIPGEDRFFFLMPFVLSGTQVSAARRGMYLYDGGNGGFSGCQVAMERIGSKDWSASSEKCDLRWSKSDAQGNIFCEDRISVIGLATRWDVQISPFLTDEQDSGLTERQAGLKQWVLLRRFPFVHRVPRLKGYATGTIEQEGRTHSFKGAPLYQAKNHGHGFPEAWIWIHANAFGEDENLALEAATLRTADGVQASMVRIARPDGVQLLCSWRGDDVRVDCVGDHYTFSAVSQDKSLFVTGIAAHGDSVKFSFPSPDGSYFANDECFVGVLSANIQGLAVTTSLAALGRAQRVAHPVRDEVPMTACI